MGKELFSEELKLAVVQYVLEGHTRKEASEKFCVSCTPIEKWVNLYKLHGAKGLLSRNLVGRQKGFDGEFRLKVLQYKQEHHLACRSASALKGGREILHSLYTGSYSERKYIVNDACRILPNAFAKSQEAGGAFLSRVYNDTDIQIVNIYRNGLCFHVGFNNGVGAIL